MVHLLTSRCHSPLAVVLLGVGSADSDMSFKNGNGVTGVGLVDIGHGVGLGIGGGVGFDTGGGFGEVIDDRAGNDNVTSGGLQWYIAQHSSVGRGGGIGAGVEIEIGGGVGGDHGTSGGLQ